MANMPRPPPVTLTLTITCGAWRMVRSMRWRITVARSRNPAPDTRLGVEDVRRLPRSKSRSPHCTSTPSMDRGSFIAQLQFGRSPEMQGRDAGERRLPATSRMRRSVWHLPSRPCAGSESDRSGRRRVRSSSRPRRSRHRGPRCDLKPTPAMEHPEPAGRRGHRRASRAPQTSESANQQIGIG